MIKNSKISLFRIIDYVIIFLVIINSGYALTTGMNSVLLYSQILLLCLIIIANGRYFKIPKHDFRQLAIILMFISMVAALVINFDFDARLTYLHCALYIAIAYFINISYESSVIISAFLKIMFVVAVIGIAVSVLNFIIPFSSYSLVITNGADVQYYSLGVVNFIKSTFASHPRCCGIFWEPGLYAGFLGLAALFDLKENDDSKRMWRIAVYCVAIFFTYSTAGFIYIIMIIMLTLSQRLSNIAGTVVLSIIGVLLTVALINIDFVVDILVRISPQVFSKIVWRNESYLTRSMSPLADLNIIFHNPFGVGYGNIQNLRVNTLKTLGADVSLSTSTLTYHGASCGILFLIVYNVLWIRNFLFNNKNVLFKILSSLLFIMILTANPMYNNQFVWILLFFNFTQIKGKDIRLFKKSNIG